jgi:hypothetical protein
MHLKTRHRQIAHALWECGGRIDDAAQRQHIQPGTIRRWLADPDFRTLVAQDAMEPLLQATSAMMRWAPVAVARLIRDLESESSTDARLAAREVLKLALETHRELSRPAEDVASAAGNADPPAEARDPLSRRVAALTDDQLARVLAIVNGAGAPAAPCPSAATKGGRA